MTSKDAVPGAADALALPKIKFRTFFETSTKGTFFNVETSFCHVDGHWLEFKRLKSCVDL